LGREAGVTEACTLHAAGRDDAGGIKDEVKAEWLLIAAGQRKYKQLGYL